MSGAEKLKDKIISAANIQAENVLEEARQKAAAILSTGQAEAGAKEKAVLEEGIRQAQEHLRRAKTIAELDARKAILTAKTECIQDTLSQAIVRLQGLDEPAYEELMYTMLLAASQTGTEEVIVSMADQARFTTNLLSRVNSALVRQGKQGNLKLATTNREMSGGFVLSAGDVEINSSFNSLLRMQRDQLEPEIAAILFN